VPERRVVGRIKRYESKKALNRRTARERREVIGRTKRYE
jgi:hypothetical protein